MSKPLIEVTGFKELQDKIKLIADDKTKRSEVLKILRVVARPTVQSAKAFAPERVAKSNIKTRITTGGILKKSIGTITGKSLNPTILVGPKVKGKNKGYYGAWVELGHNIYHKNFKLKRNRKGTKVARKFNKANRTGKTTAKFFMKKSFELTKGQVTNEAEKKIAAYIQKKIDKLSK
jgi:hypothetical protein